jgi:hypothetical protein
MGIRIGDKLTVTSHDEERDTYDIEFDKTHAVITVRKSILDEVSKECYEERLSRYLGNEWELGEQKVMLENYDLNNEVVYLSTDKDEFSMSIDKFLSEWSPVINDYYDGGDDRHEALTDEQRNPSISKHGVKIV